MSPKILILGSGGREHALCWHLKKTNIAVECAPGSDAIAELCPTWNFKDFEDLSQKIKDKKITEVIVGPEKYLAEGVSDFLIQKKIKVFGPTKTAALLETDKAFAKSFLFKHKIPTARSVTAETAKELTTEIKKFLPPYVIKASGLAAGKGVWIGSNQKDAIAFGSEMLKEHASLVLEEFLKGEELSYFVLIDGKHHKFFGAAQDHKRLLENDEGPNTGGMGAYSPVPLLNPQLQTKIEKKIIQPVLKGLEKDSIFYRGFLFVGIMVVADEPYVLEFNCRLGDPETQALLLRLKTPLTEILSQLESGSEKRVEFLPGVSLNVVIAAKGYPENPGKDFELVIDRVPKECFVFHSGTKRTQKNWLPNGGRLFSINTIQNSLIDCQNAIYPWIAELPFLKKVTYRKDIGVKAYRHLRALN
ncbi:MAG: Phosphoribosylamine--glycine ligase [Bacteriovoracaceae bacterium]|nr:Phosphoribosylamine--glycine ligase [Bacteriovoracaceae bacterium]